MQSIKKMTDDQLVNAYAQGNNPAFDELLMRHRQRVYAYIMQMVKDPDASEDIFQETFVKAIMTIRQGRYNEVGKFSAWITRIARNLIIDFFRQEKAEASVSTDDENYDVLNRRELSEGTVEDMMIDSQIRADIRKIIMHLPESQREVLMMRYYKNLSFKEIAELTGVSINTALGRMRYAILNLRRVAKENNIALTH
ncbi:MAG: sigma-70 family RNA polymerase sigma factor [Muribaculaceae bacterium]|nr:sigma-70 family RNA polymerase sigma factor [Muribaculaceae bacterium]